MSMVGATYILQDILKNKKRRNESIKRIVVAMSISDLICCFIGPFLGSLMIDEAEVQVWGQGTMGNRTTCTIQGFLLTTFLTSSYAYNTTLSVCHLLMIRYGFNDRRLRTLEPYLLYPPFILGLIFAILPLFFQAYHFDSVAGPVCMISAIPIGCDRSDSDTECVQGQYRKILYWTFTGVVCVLNGVTGLSMFLLYRSVLEQQRKGERYSFRRLNSNTLRRSSVRAGRGVGADLGAGAGAGAGVGGRSRRFSLRRNSLVAPRRTLSSTIGRQGLWYSASFFITLFPSLIVAVISFVFEAKVPYWLAIVAGLTLPMVGFANAIVYARPRYVKLRIDFPHLGFGRSVIHTIRRTKPPKRQIQQHQQQKKSKQTPANANQNQYPQLPASASATTTTTTHTSTSISSSIRNSIHKVLYSMSINLRIFKDESKNKNEERDVDLDDVGVGVDAEVSSVVAMASKKSKSELKPKPKPKLKPKQNPPKGLRVTFGTKNNADVDVNVHAVADVDAGIIVDVDVEANNEETNVEFDIDVEQANNNNETNLDKEDTGTTNNHDDDHT